MGSSIHKVHARRNLTPILLVSRNLASNGFKMLQHHASESPTHEDSSWKTRFPLHRGERTKLTRRCLLLTLNEAPCQSAFWAETKGECQESDANASWCLGAVKRCLHTETRQPEILHLANGITHGHLAHGRFASILRETQHYLHVDEAVIGLVTERVLHRAIRLEAIAGWRPCYTRLEAMHIRKCVFERC